MKRLYVKITALALIILSCFIFVSCSDEIVSKEAEATITEFTPAFETTEAGSSETSPTAISKILYKKNKSFNKPLLIGHRGYSGKYPESTLEAFNGAFKKGFDGIECDIWETDSDDLLIQHDSTTTRTTGKREYIWRLSKEERKNYPIINGNYIEKYKNKKLIIPTFEEVVKTVSENDGYLLLHIKNNPKYFLTENGQNEIIGILREYKMQNRTLIFGGRNYIKPFTDKGFKTGVFVAPKSRKQLETLARWCKKNKVNTMVFGNLKKVRSIKGVRHLNKFLKKKKLDFGVYKTTSKKQYKYLRRIGAWFSMSDYFVK